MNKLNVYALCSVVFFSIGGHHMEEPYKEVFELRVFGELSFAQIGAIFRKTESWARVTYHRARLKLKERMDKNEI